jgi:hypothetical protein
MTVSTANHVFLPWVRQGAAAGIQTIDTLNDTPAGVVSVPVKLRVNNSNEIERKVRLYGPGDVIGIDPLQVIRTEPRNLATDFEPNYFAAIEFDRPDFLWLFTPAKADASNRLRPWLCLVVVRKQKGVTLRTDRNLLLPILEIKDPALPKNELPDLSESWAWAHAQVTGSPPQQTSLQQSLAGNPAFNLSRLLSPRRLDPLTDYIACVVPAFDLGVKAGLGSQISPDDEKSLKPAWASGAQSPAQVQLPVYYSWEFHTGNGADFEALVNLLEARDQADMPPEIGKKNIDISQPGFLITPPLQTGTTIELEGALRIADSSVADWPAETQTRFQAELKKILEVPWLAMKNGNVDPLVAPPIYGCWHVGLHLLNTSAVPPAVLPWLDELNLDPRHRSVAALGTAVIQSEQEQLMAAAWEQLGEIERINQMRRQAQLGRAVNTVYRDKHFSRFSEEALLKVVAPAQARLLVETIGVNNQKTRALLSQRITQSALPDRALSATLRKMTSSRSPLSARFQLRGAAPIAFVAKLNTLALVVTAQRSESGVVPLDQVTDSLAGTVAAQLKPIARFDRIITALSTSPKLGDFTIASEGVTPKRNLLSFTPPGSPDSAEALAFREAATAHQNYLAQASIVPTFAQFAPMNMGTTKEPLLQSIDPAKTIKARVQASLEISGPSEIAGDPLEPLLDAPEFPQPMYEALRDLSQDFLFPGLEKVPANTITLLETNSKFVESFLIGLNVEMNREFLWRNYPTDQRGTFFRQFWDTSAGSGQQDIKRIHEWGDQSQLGHNANAGDDLVLLIRGELLRRYPNSVIYAVAAVKNNDGKFDLSPKPEDEKHPLFRGTLNPDVTFLGFDLRRKDAIADPGWFFVIQEQPTEPRFGLDVADFVKPLPALTTWNNLSWRHLAATPDQLKALSHVSITTQLGKIDPAEWGRNSAHQAFITLQRPVRVAIHAKEMLVKG